MRWRDINWFGPAGRSGDPQWGPYPAPEPPPLRQTDPQGRQPPPRNPAYDYAQLATELQQVQHNVVHNIPTLPSYMTEAPPNYGTLHTPGIGSQRIASTNGQDVPLPSFRGAW